MFLRSFFLRYGFTAHPKKCSFATHPQRGVASRFWALSFLIGFFLFAEACGTDLVLAPTAKENFNLGETLIKKKKYDDATKAFEEAIRLDVSSSSGISSELRLADIMFIKEEYQGAAERYRNFIDDHREHKYTLNGYCAFRIGESYFKMLPSRVFIFPPVYERELGETDQAFIALQNFLHAYPKSEYIVQVRKMYDEVLKRLFEHERYVAKFYIKQKKWKGAEWRLQEAQKKFLDTPYEAEVLFLLGQVYLKEEQPNEARNSFLALKSKYAKDKLLPKAEAYLSEIDKKYPQLAQEKQS